MMQYNSWYISCGGTHSVQVCVLIWGEKKPIEKHLEQRDFGDNKIEKVKSWK